MAGVNTLADRLDSLLRRGNVARAAEAVLTLTGADRRALVPLIKAADPVPPAGDETGPSPTRRAPDGRVAGERREAVLRVCGAACLPRPAEVISWLRSTRFHWGMTAPTIAAIVRVLGELRPDELPVIAEGLASKVRVRDDGQNGWDLAVALVRAAGLPPPATEAMVRGWIRAATAPVPKRAPKAPTAEVLAGRLAADPWLEAYLPLLFALPKVAADLDDSWPPALAQLAAEGRIARADLIPLLLSRMRGGEPSGSMRVAVATYRLLDLTLDERYDHLRDLLALLGGPHVGVAELSQQALRTLDEAGRLDAGTVAEAGRLVLGRTEKKLVRAQLAWLDKSAARHPDEARTVLGAATTGLGDTSGELPERALRVLGRHPAGRAVLQDAAGGLGGDLRRQADERLGSAGVPSAPLFPPPPVPSVPVAMPAPIRSVAELTEAVAATGYDLRPVELERVLAGVARFAHSSPAALADAFGPLTATGPLSAVIRAVTGQPRHLGDEPRESGRTGDHQDQGRLFESPLGRERRELGRGGFRRELGRAAERRELRRAAGRSGPGPADAPEGVFTAGAREGLGRSREPRREAGPGSGSGSGSGEPDRISAARDAAERLRLEIDAALGRRLGARDWQRNAGAAGRPAPPQAMVLARIAELAARITAGDASPLLAVPADLDGHVDPARLLLRLVEAENDGRTPGPYDLAQALLRLPRKVDAAVGAAAGRLRSPAGRRFAAWLRDGGLPDPAVTVLPGRRGVTFAPLPARGLTVPAGLLAPPTADSGADLACWPMVLPSHREIIAAHCLPHLLAENDPAEKDDDGAVLPVLARSAGPYGPAMALLVAHGLAAAAPEDRRPAVAAVRQLARSGGIDAALTGRELGLLLVAGPTALPGAVDALAEIARGGSPHVVWAITHTVVPMLVRLEHPPAGLPELLSFAAATAAAIGAHADLPDLTAVAARPDRTRLKTEAARLARTLR